MMCFYISPPLPVSSPPPHLSWNLLSQPLSVRLSRALLFSCLPLRLPLNLPVTPLLPPPLSAFLFSVCPTLSHSFSYSFPQPLVYNLPCLFLPAFHLPIHPASFLSVSPLLFLHVPVPQPLLSSLFLFLPFRLPLSPFLPSCCLSLTKPLHLPFHLLSICHCSCRSNCFRLAIWAMLSTYNTSCLLYLDTVLHIDVMNAIPRHRSSWTLARALATPYHTLSHSPAKI